MTNSKVVAVIPGFRRFEFFLGIIHRILIGFVTIYVSWLCLRRIPFDDVPYHALLCTIGFNFLMAEGLISFYKGNSSTYGCVRNRKTGLHIVLQLIGSGLGIAGIAIRMTIDKIHFTTLHGQLGLAALVLCGLSLFLGLSALLSVKMKDCVQPVMNKIIHSVLGIATFTIAIVCSIYGFDTGVFATIAPVDMYDYVSVKTVLKVATGANLILSIYGPLAVSIQKLWNYFK